MAILKTKTQRVFFIIAILGGMFFIARLSVWLSSPERDLFGTHLDVPNSDGYVGRKVVSDFVQNYKTCKWVDTKPNKLKESSNLILANDTLYALNKNCITDIHHNKSGELEYKVSGYELFAMGPSNIIEVDGGDYFTVDYETTYFDYVEARSFSTISKSKAAKCLVKSPRWCLESSSVIYSNVMAIIFGDVYFKYSSLLIVLGLAGSLFFSLFSGIWLLTFGKLINWVKSGN